MNAHSTFAYLDNHLLYVNKHKAAGGGIGMNTEDQFNDRILVYLKWIYYFTENASIGGKWREFLLKPFTSRSNAVNRKLLNLITNGTVSMFINETIENKFNIENDIPEVEFKDIQDFLLGIDQMIERLVIALAPENAVIKSIGKIGESNLEYQSHLDLMCSWIYNLNCYMHSFTPSSGYQPYLLNENWLPSLVQYYLPSMAPPIDKVNGSPLEDFMRILSENVTPSVWAIPENFSNVLAHRHIFDIILSEIYHHLESDVEVDPTFYSIAPTPKAKHLLPKEVPIKDGPCQQEVPIKDEPCQKEVPIKDEPCQKEVPIKDEPCQKEVPIKDEPCQKEVPIKDEPCQKEVPIKDEPCQKEVPIKDEPCQKEVPIKDEPCQKEVPIKDEPCQKEVPIKDEPCQKEVPIKDEPCQKEVPIKDEPCQKEVPIKDEPCQKEVPIKDEPCQQEVPIKDEPCQKEVPIEDEAYQKEVPINFEPCQKFPETKHGLLSLDEILYISDKLDSLTDMMRKNLNAQTKTQPEIQKETTTQPLTTGNTMNKKTNLVSVFEPLTVDFC
ncbi:Cornifin alpha [Thelohanellus kitauei]|uniref:Cornifin alpha n=1 Tax=Thelohanellus kitauei TaxID=669202 RepID=A0A0C2JES6_THEKT|nr:Cornifin alpha [Thelohanellus kitauei]